ncbi:MAG TPA: CheR family methyltransferase, partial [Polyangiaceae bacterium]|nr:CheR family methyltransferase [Polyangiaceae bacterium]
MAAGPDGAAAEDGEAGEAAEGASAEGEAQLDALLDYLFRSRGFDFQGYKRSSLLRRIQKRMQTAGVADFGAYLDRLEVDPEEFAQLFNTILINVTSFFRDGEVWQSLRDHVEARVMRRRQPGDVLRVWNAGCASGEEAYSTAIMLAEMMGVDEFCKTTKIYATDVDDDALRQARLATYPPKAVEGVAPALLEKYFERVGPNYVVNKDLRRCVIFGRHNLIQDAPISRVDLLSCRNTLMYFNAETQARILARLHFALNEDGVLFLGKAEMLLIHRQLFSPLDLKRRIFAKVGRGPRLERLLPGGPPSGDEAAAPGGDQARLRDGAFEVGASAQLVLDLTSAVVLVNDRARTLFGLGSQDLGRPFRELEIAKRGDLRQSVERALEDRRPTVLLGVEWSAGGLSLTFEIHVVPISDAGGAAIGGLVCFLDAS